jgi:hypothetical protein
VRTGHPPTYLTVIEEGEPEDVAVYGPTCAKREFEGDHD